MAREEDVLLDRPGGTAISSQGITFTKLADASTLTGAYASVSSDASGRFRVDTDGHPGPLQWANTTPISGETWRRESKSVGLAGALSVGEAWLFGWALGGELAGGVVDGYLNELVVTTAVVGIGARALTGTKFSAAMTAPAAVIGRGAVGLAGHGAGDVVAVSSSEE